MEFQFPINIEEALQLILKINTFSDYELIKFVYFYFLKHNEVCILNTIIYGIESIKLVYWLRPLD